MLRPLDISPDWKVDVTFEARAAFYRPTDIKGRGWVSTAGVKGGGKVSLPSISMHSALYLLLSSLVLSCLIAFLNKATISIHTKDGEDDIVVLRWMDFRGEEGLNCIILPGLPIQRGVQEEDTEFFFKSVSTTVLEGTSRKTVFALKFRNSLDADDFHTWWDLTSGFAEMTTLEHFFANSKNKLEDILYICPIIVFKYQYATSGNKKRKLCLESFGDVSGVERPWIQKPDDRGTFQDLIDSGSPAQVATDRDIHKRELLQKLQQCLIDHAADSTLATFEMKDVDPQLRTFTCEITGVPQRMCRYLRIYANQAARDSAVSAVVAEQIRMDYIAENMAEADLETFLASGTATAIANLTFDENMIRYSPRKPGRIPPKPIPECNDGNNGDDCKDVLLYGGSPPSTQQYNWG